MRDTEKIKILAEESCRGGAMRHAPVCACAASPWSCGPDCPGCTCGLQDKTLGEREQSPNLCRVGKQYCAACAAKDAEILSLRLMMLEKEAEIRNGYKTTVDPIAAAELRGHADAARQLAQYARNMPPWPPAKYSAEEQAAWMRGWELASASIREYLGVLHASPASRRTKDEEKDIATREKT